jgi:hypothetical protein
VTTVGEVGVAKTSTTSRDKQNVDDGKNGFSPPPFGGIEPATFVKFRRVSILQNFFFFVAVSPDK